MKVVAARFLTAALFANVACGASLSAKRLGNGTPVQGVPFRLPVATFVIAETPPVADKPTAYTLTLVETPDAAEVYDLKVTPGAFASSEITFSFGGQGQLTGLNTSSTPAAVPLIKAVGDFVVGAVGVAAKAAALAAADSSDGKPPGLLGGLAQLKQNSPEVCARRPDVQKLTGDVAAKRAAQANLNKLLSVCKADVQVAVDTIRSRLNPDLDNAANFDRLYTTNDTQRAALEVLANDAKAFGVDPIWWTVSLRCCSLHGMYQFELDGAGVVDRRVATLDVVEAVDVIGDR